MELLAAFTETEYPEDDYYPGYVNISADGEDVVISVRSRGSDAASEVRIPWSEFENMHNELNDNMRL